MLNDQFKLIGELIESLGREDFDECFFRLYDEILGIAIVRFLNSLNSNKPAS